MARPLLSVAIPAYDNGHLLGLTLASLTRQTMPRDDFEVVVVDDGSEPSLASVVEPFADRLHLNFLRHTPNRGRSVTRNRALRAARADLVLFVDADCCAHPSLVQRHHEFHARRGLRPGVLLGRVLAIDWAAAGALTRGETPGPPVLGDYREDLRDYLFAAAHRRRDFARAPWVYGFSGNASADRASLDEVGGFDEDLVKWGGEDLELFYRVYHHRGGGPDLFGLDDDALCYHLPHFRSWPKLAAQLVDNYQHIARKHRRYDVEMLGLMGNSGIAVKRIMWYGDGIDACRRNGLGQVSSLPSTYRAGMEEVRCLVVGFGASKLPLPPGSATFDHDAPLDDDNPHLLGLNTLYPDRQFERVVSVDLWRFLSPEDLGAFVTEGLRIAARVDLVSTDQSLPAAALMPLPFVDDIAYIRTSYEPHFDVDLSYPQGCAVLALAARMG